MIEKSIFATVIVAVSCMVGGAFFHYFPQGLALFSGAVWGAVNLFFLKIVLQNIVLRKKNVLLALCVKCPLLYLAGYALLKTHYLPSMYLLLGFSIIFIMIFLFSCIGALKLNGK